MLFRSYISGTVKKGKASHAVAYQGFLNKLFDITSGGDNVLLSDTNVILSLKCYKKGLNNDNLDYADEISFREDEEKTILPGLLSTLILPDYYYLISFQPNPVQTMIGSCGTLPATP